MKARYILIVSLLAILGGCGPQEHTDPDRQIVANVIHSVDGTTLVINANMIFEDDRISLKDSAVSVLRSLYWQVDGEHFSNIRVTAHSDDTITEGTAMEVTNLQAQVVAGYLWFKGVDVSEIESYGVGFHEPIADMGSSLGVFTNQRIEILLT